MMTELFGLTTAAGHLTNITKTIFQAHSQIQKESVKVDFNEALLDFQSKMLALQASYQSLLESNESLKKQLAAFEKWEKESGDYQLTKQGEAAFYYVPMQSKPGDPQYALCANCWEEKRKSILQSTLAEGQLKCPKCQSTVMLFR